MAEKKDTEKPMLKGDITGLCGDILPQTVGTRMNRKKWPPIDPGTVVMTTVPDMKKRREWTDEGWARRKWDVRGTIITHHDSHGLCYDVQHPDGTLGCYNPNELEVVT